MADQAPTSSNLDEVAPEAYLKALSEAEAAFSAAAKSPTPEAKAEAVAAPAKAAASKYELASQLVSNGALGDLSKIKYPADNDAVLKTLQDAITTIAQDKSPAATLGRAIIVAVAEATDKKTDGFASEEELLELVELSAEPVIKSNEAAVKESMAQAIEGSQDAEAGEQRKERAPDPRPMAQPVGLEGIVSGAISGVVGGIAKSLSTIVSYAKPNAAPSVNKAKDIIKAPFSLAKSRFNSSRQYREDFAKFRRDAALGINPDTVWGNRSSALEAAGDAFSETAKKLADMNPNSTHLKRTKARYTAELAEARDLMEEVNDSADELKPGDREVLNRATRGIKDRLEDCSKLFEDKPHLQDEQGLTNKMISAIGNLFKFIAKKFGFKKADMSVFDEQKAPAASTSAAPAQEATMSPS